MSRYEIPLWIKVVFWTIFVALFLSYTLAPLYMAPVDPPIPP